MDALTIAYTFSGLICIGFYLPQIWQLLSVPESRAGISPMTWAMFINSSLFGVVYAFFKTDDIYFQIIISGYLIGNVAVYTAALLPKHIAVQARNFRLPEMWAALYRGLMQQVLGTNFRTYP